VYVGARATTADSVRGHAAGTTMAELEKAIQQGDDTKILRIAEKLAKSNPKDANARHAMIVALIRLEKFEEAVEMLKGMENVDTELAYCLYRMGNLERALSVASDTSHLKAQIVCK
jgi:Flp pilus assembly protein TadD